MKYALYLNDSRESPYFDSFGEIFKFALEYNNGSLVKNRAIPDDWDGSPIVDSISVEIRRFDDSFAECIDRSIFDWIDEDYEE